MTKSDITTITVWVRDYVSYLNENPIHCSEEPFTLTLCDDFSDADVQRIRGIFEEEMWNAPGHCHCGRLVILRKEKEND